MFYLHRKSLSLMMAPVLVFILARFVFLGALAGFQMEAPRAPLAPRPSPKVIPVPISIPHQMSLSEPDSNSLKMNSIIREYRYLMSGRVTCGSQSCVRDVEITLNSDHNENVVRTVQSDSEGYFSTEIPIKEFARRPVDWRMQVDVVDSLPVEVYGRTILSQDTEIEISRSLSLPQ